MQKVLIAALTCTLFFNPLAAQKKEHLQKPTLAIHFILNDFYSAAQVRATSLSTAIRTHNFGDLKQMTPGLAINYMKGLSDHFDFTTTFAGSFLDYPMPDKPPFNEDAFLLEADASVRGKLLDNKHWVSPYLQAGIGVSKYKGYYGAFIPAGMGLQINFFPEAAFLINAQYRVQVTPTTNFHFYYSIGLAGAIGK